MIWSAPFFSGGGYCSEALAFVLALSPHLPSSLQIVQHGDSLSQSFYRGLPSSVQSSLLSLLHHPIEPSTAVSICHSEPGAWYPPHYQTSRCPPLHSAVSIGRTMFETDRLPQGWSQRLQAMDWVWVPSEFSRQVFIRGGVDEHRIRVIPEPVDVEAFHPQTEPMEFSRGEKERWRKGREQRPFRFLSIFKWSQHQHRRTQWGGAVKGGRTEVCLASLSSLSLRVVRSSVSPSHCLCLSVSLCVLVGVLW